MTEIEHVIEMLALEVEQLSADAAAGRPANAQQAKRLAAMVERLRSLQNGTNSGTIQVDMLTNAQLAGVRSRSNRSHPWQAWIYDGSRNSGPRTLAEAAEALTSAGIDVSAERAKSWVKPSETGRRRIPLDIAKRIEKLWGYKATEANWPQGFVPTSRRKG